ncbi:hypothetical protein H2248_011774 [Termitomyces sp. 'cryptogamus']|nr:hypothetical protein H2248_011774 [Termitomyces sp. 'cryptogamus']
MHSPHSLQDTFVSKLFPNPPQTNLPLEIIELVIDEVDPSYLLKLSLVSKAALRRSRVRLFSSLSFIKDDGTRWIHETLPKEGTVDHQLDCFLDLLQSPHNTIATSIKNLHLHYLFNSKCYEYGPRDEMHLVATKLSQLACLRLSSLNWNNIPRHILEWIQALPATELQIESTNFQTLGFIELLQSSLITLASLKLSFCGIRIKDEKNTMNLTSHSHIFAQKYQFSALDITSLLLFRDVWDYAMTTGAHIMVHKLFLHLKTTGSPYTDYIPALPFLNATLCRIGPCLESLCLALGDHEGKRCELWMDTELNQCAPAERGFYRKLDLSRCTALEAIHVGVIILGQQEADMEKVWDHLNRLTPSLIESVGFILHASMISSAEYPKFLFEFPWKDTIHQLTCLFPLLKRVKFTIGYFHPAHGKELPIHLEAIKSDIHTLKTSVKVIFKADTETNFHLGFRFPWRLCYF